MTCRTSPLGRALSSLLRRLVRWRVVNYDEWKTTRDSLDALSLVYRHTVRSLWPAPPADSSASPCSFIVFSKDRPAQLHALLGSLADNVRPRCRVYVLYAASHSRYEEAYLEVFRDPSIEPMAVVPSRQTARLKVLLQEVLADVGTARVCLLVDDLLFLRPVDMALLCSYDPSFYVPSLRLGLNIVWCPFRQRAQSLPESISESAGLITWDWASGDGAWGYPMSLDGNVFSTSEFRDMVDCIDFATPNFLESKLYRTFGRWLSLRRGVCYRESRLVNLPWNRVQQDFANFHGQTPADTLLEHWASGARIDFRSYYGLQARATHEAWHVQLRRPETARDYRGPRA